MLGMRYKKVSLKFANMRKPQEFIMHTATSIPSNETVIILQSDKSIGRLDVKKRELVWTNKGNHFPHLAFAEPVNLPEDMMNELIQLAKELN
jgi:hypothetical protein